MNPEPMPHAGAGEARHLFATTSWTQVVQATDGSATALDSLCTRYRSALLSWLRGRGARSDEAEDMVQGFFLHLLRSEFLARVSREKGKFRNFLLSSFKHYLADERDRAAAAKRGGGNLPVSLDETDGDGRPLRDFPSAADAPDLTFDRAWAMAILNNSLQCLHQECAHTGHEALYVALEPALYADKNAPAYVEIGRKMCMSEAAVKMAASRIRKRLNAIIRDEVLETLAGDGDLHDELRYLSSLFGKTSAFGAFG